MGEKKKEKDGSSNDKKKQLSELCRVYNLKTCKHQADRECKTRPHGGKH